MIEQHTERLISRIVAGEAEAGEFEQFTRLAERDADLWRELAMSQRDQAELVAVMEKAGAVAERIETAAEEEEPPMITIARGRADDSHHGPVRVAGAWSGWAIAATIGLAWFFGGLSQKFTQPAPNGDSPTQQAGIKPGIIPVSNASEALDAYVQKGREEGRLLSEHPQRLLVRTQPAESGDGIEVIYIQQFMERVVVPDVYRISGQDEHGRPTLVRFEPNAGGNM
jgi:hypothetical protein